MKRSILIFLDKTLFSVLFFICAIFEKFNRKVPGIDPSFSGNESVLVIRPGGLGDGLMVAPFLKFLKTNYPNVVVTILCVKKNATAFSSMALHDDLIVLDNSQLLVSNILTLRKRRFDVVFDFEPFRKISAVISFYTGANVRIGFDTNRRRLLYTHFVRYANEKYFESENMVHQLRVFGICVPRKIARDLSFELPASSVRDSRAILSSHGVTPMRDVLITVTPGVLKAHHRWRMDRFSGLIQKILDDDANVTVIILGSKGDIHDAQAVYAPFHNSGRVINLTGSTNFLESLGILQLSDVLIACDGGIVYMAAAMGCKTISIWGPGVMERFKPPGSIHVGVRKQYPCIPCVNYDRLGEFPPCPYNRKCINDISIKDVFDGYLQLKATNFDTPTPGFRR
jgi:ADP-heptose:LPS heptosyltransferase